MTENSDLQLWQAVIADTEFLARATEVDATVPRELAALRAGHDPREVQIALELVEARRRGLAKFDRAAELVSDREGMEQATSQRVADHKARRIAELSDAAVVRDLCSGIGGDTMSLGQRVAVEAIDSDPVRAWMTECNGRVYGADVRTRVADVTSLDFAGCTVHIDPARRTGDRRHWRYQDYVPGPAFLDALCQSTRGAAVKLGPGIDVQELPPGEVEFIADAGLLVQAVLWSGELARTENRVVATRLPNGDSIAGQPGVPLSTSDGRFRNYLYVPDVALERAELVAEHPQSAQLEELVPGLGLVTSDATLDDWFTGFAVEEVLPWRPKTVRAWLRERDAGSVEVKTRGGAVDPAKARKELKGSGSESYVVFVLRLGKSIQAVVTRRM